MSDMNATNAINAMNANPVIAPVLKNIIEHSGIYVSHIQLPSLVAHIEKQAAVRKLTVEEYVKLLVPNTPDFDAIINQVTVNETYFFREESQFDFLKQLVFPKYMGRELSIWSCCCSTGEEAISLLALAASMNVNLTIYASDIDDKALAHFKNGRYSVYSLRPDGKKYHSLLAPYYKKEENELVFRKDFINRIHVFKFNLNSGMLSTLPFCDGVDIIFMRNVFIYFDQTTRKNIAEKISFRLKNNGMLFYSMNEIGSLDESMMPYNVTKTNSGSVYYFVKSTDVQKSDAHTPVSRSLKKKQIEKENQKLQREVQKNKVQKHAQLSKRESDTEVKNTESVIEAKVRQVYEDMCNEIHNGDFDKARKLALTISGTGTKKYSFFMQGYIEYHADNRAAAENFFASTEAIAQDFWPAFFYHGMVLRDLGKIPQANAYFSKCKKLITDCGDNNPYDFALDSFSPAYISSLCDTFSIGGGQ